MGRRAGFLTMCALAAMISARVCAQENEVNVDSKEPAVAKELAGETNLFQNLKVEMLDLDLLREEVERKLLGEPVKMTLADCVQTALKSNQDILIAGYGIAVSDANLMSAHGQFDPSLALSANDRSDARPASAQIQDFTGGNVLDIKSKGQDYQLALNGLTWIGTQYSF